MNEDDGFADWAFEAAGQVMEHVERHGVPITWSEAHLRLLQEAGQGPARLVIEDEADESFVLSSPLGWQHPDFIESVAASHVHFHGRAYRPTRRDSEVPVGVSIHTMVEVQVRLSFLLHACLAGRTLDIDLSRLSSLATEFGYHLGTDHLMDLDEGCVEDTLEGSAYVVLSARELSEAIDFLENGEDVITRAAAKAEEHVVGRVRGAASHLSRGLLLSLASRDEHRACVLAARWRLGVA